MQTKYIIFEVDANTGIISSDTLEIYDSFRFINWKLGENEYILRFGKLGSYEQFATIKDLLNDNPITVVNNIEVEEITPVGSLEFVEQFMCKTVKPINIPIQIYKQCQDLVGRKIWYINNTKDDINQVISEAKSLGFSELFVKGNVGCKKFDADIFDFTSLQAHNKLPAKLFISETLDIEAEWRAFVFRGQILDCKQYLGNYKSTYSTDALDKAVKVWTDSPSAYTLDIAKLSDGRTVIIEAHNFISCGLYGFADKNKLAFMVRAAYREEKSNKASR